MYFVYLREKKSRHEGKNGENCFVSVLLFLKKNLYYDNQVFSVYLLTLPKFCPGF